MQNVLDEHDLKNIEFLINDNFRSVGCCQEIFDDFVVTAVYGKGPKPDKEWRRLAIDYLTILSQYAVEKSDKSAITVFHIADLAALMKACEDKTSNLPDDCLDVVSDDTLELASEWLQFVLEVPGQHPGTAMSVELQTVMGFND